MDALTAIPAATDLQEQLRAAKEALDEDEYQNNLAAHALASQELLWTNACKRAAAHFSRAPETLLHQDTLQEFRVEEAHLGGHSQEFQDHFRGLGYVVAVEGADVVVRCPGEQ